MQISSEILGPVVTFYLLFSLHNLCFAFACDVCVHLCMCVKEKKKNSINE